MYIKNKYRYKFVEAVGNAKTFANYSTAALHASQALNCAGIYETEVCNILDKRGRTAYAIRLLTDAGDERGWISSYSLRK